MDGVFDSLPLESVNIEAVFAFIRAYDADDAALFTDDVVAAFPPVISIEPLITNVATALSHAKYPPFTCDDVKKKLPVLLIKVFHPVTFPFPL